jgi:hypothetical protein
MQPLLNPTQLAVYKLIKVFVERQKIVFGAMIELHPLLMARAGVIPESQLPQNVKERRLSSIVFAGDWGEAKEWNYYLHGAGCRLVHKTTGEPIEWDASDVKRFDSYWFTKWIEWSLEQESYGESIEVIKSHGNLDGDRLREFVFDTLSQLHDLGVLAQGYPFGPTPTKYVVV